LFTSRTNKLQNYTTNSNSMRVENLFSTLCENTFFFAVKKNLEFEMNIITIRN